MKWDINSDLGEVEPWKVTRGLARVVNSMNVACGGHAGDVASMRRCVQLARAEKIYLGAHPGPLDRENMGRSPVKIGVGELELLLLQQVGALERIAREEKVRLHHIKLHGGLYHAVESDVKLARGFLKVVERYWPGVLVYAKAGGTVVKSAPRSGVQVWGEAFLDRGYECDGSLTPRSQAGALLSSAEQVRARWNDLITKGGVTCRTGEWLPLKWQTLCVHSDTPHIAESTLSLRSA